MPSHPATCTCSNISFSAAVYDGCHIQKNATDATGRATYQSSPQATYGCVKNTDTNCDYDVHVLSTFEGNGDVISWLNVLSTGDINVAISVGGTGDKSLVLVLLNHYPLNWVLDVPSGVVIEKVLLVSQWQKPCIIMSWVGRNFKANATKSEV
jgi:hypothetical protein